MIPGSTSAIWLAAAGAQFPLSSHDQLALDVFREACFEGSVVNTENRLEPQEFRNLPYYAARWFDGLKDIVKVYKVRSKVRTFLVYFERPDAKGDYYKRGCAIVKRLVNFERLSRNIADYFGVNLPGLSNVQNTQVYRFEYMPLSGDFAYDIRGEKLADDYTVIQISFLNDADRANRKLRSMEQSAVTDQETAGK